MNKHEYQQAALSRAVNGEVVSNYPAIVHGFMAKGIPIDEIKPRENVFTFAAWKALGRYVRKGEHGVQVFTVITMSKENKDTGEPETFSHPRSVTVFHISQTEPMA